MTKERIEKLLKAGANVILTTKGIDDMALKVRLKTNNFPSLPLHITQYLKYSVLLAFMFDASKLFISLNSHIFCFYFSTL